MAGRRRSGALPRAFYDRPTLHVARDLIGKVLYHRTPDGTTAGLIVETEAYIGESDPACHASTGRTSRNDPLYGAPGLAYVYFTYGMHHLINAVTEPEGTPAAVLIRALVPLEGIDLMHRRRGARRDGAPMPEHQLCRGPGSLAKAMGIALCQNRLDLTASQESGLWVADAGIQLGDVQWSPRIGITLGTDKLWRCFVPGNRCVSGGAAADGSARSSPARTRGTRPSSPHGPRPR